MSLAKANCMAKILATKYKSKMIWTGEATPERSVD